jgi:hypothetical protein
MRTLSPAYVVTSVVMALCGSVSYGAVVVRSGAVMTSSSAPITSPANTGAASSSAATSNPAARGNPTTTTTGSSGTATTTAASGGDGSTLGSGSTVIGSSTASSFPNQGTTAPNTVIGSSAASSIPDNSAAGASSVNSTGAITPGSGVSTFANPVIVGGYGYGMNVAEGERVDNGNANANANVAYAGAQVDQLAATDIQASGNSQSFDRAVNTVKRDRQRVGRNGQLLQSIAPRTNANRSNEMPDDPPSPALTGSSSALTAR